LERNFNYLMSTYARKNLAIIRQSFANTVFTHKVQEIATERNNSYSFYIKITNIILVSLILVVLILQVVCTNIIFTYIGMALTITEIIFLIIQLTFSFEKQAIAHKNSALKYMGLRDCYKNFITDIMESNIDNHAIQDKRDLLQKKYQVISDLSPQTNNTDYKKAQQKLNKRGTVAGEDFTWSDDEINHFLPESLRT